MDSAITKEATTVKWFRLYDDLVFNAKAQALPPKLFKHWINLLCLASRNEPRGTLPNLDRISFALRMRPERAESIIELLIRLRFLTELRQIHDWNATQFESDDSAIRKQRQRISKIDQNVTGREQDKTASDTDTEQIQIQTPVLSHQQVSDYGADFERFWKVYPKKTGKGEAWKSWRKNGHPPIEALLECIERATASTKWQEDGGKYIPNPATWLNQRRWDDEYKNSNSRPELSF